MKPNYRDRSNDEVFVSVQVESSQSIEALADIVAENICLNANSMTRHKIVILCCWLFRSNYWLRNS
ncbi:MAG: hypothetical protein O3B29_07735 [Proteobacteria bacterium]|nr:hypothetical protein [Pseudomonadota bacterium]